MLKLRCGFQDLVSGLSMAGGSSVQREVGFFGTFSVRCHPGVFSVTPLKREKTDTFLNVYDS